MRSKKGESFSDGVLKRGERFRLIQPERAGSHGEAKAAEWWTEVEQHHCPNRHVPPRFLVRPSGTVSC